MADEIKDEVDINIYRGKENKTGDIQWLKSSIANYIDSPHLNFLFGSGTSSFVKEGEIKESAIPTMDPMKKEFWGQTDLQLPQSVQNKALDLEKLIEYLQAKKMIAFEEKDKNEVQKDIDKVINFIISKISKGMGCNELLQVYKVFFKSLENESRVTPINIFSTNYDLYIEKALDSLGYYYNDGFIGTYRRTFNPISFNYIYVDDMNLQSDVWKCVPNYYNLYKIHGSISWFVDGDDIIEKCDSKGDTRVMIYPSPMKDRTTLMTPYSDLLRAMQFQLQKENSTLITFGYSFSDEHINRIIFNALSVPSFHLLIFGSSPIISTIVDKDIQRITVVNSEKTRIHYFANAVKEFFPKYQKEKESFDDLKSIISDLLNNRETDNATK